MARTGRTGLDYFNSFHTKTRNTIQSSTTKLLSKMDWGEDTDASVALSINQEYATDYLKVKRKQELTGYRAQEILNQDGYSSSSTSESEDEDAEELTPEVEVNIFKTIQMIRSKDPTIYDKDKKWFDSSSSTSTSSKKDKDKKKDQPVTFFKDYMRQRLEKAVDRGYASEEGSDVEDEADRQHSSTSSTTTMSYHEEQKELKRAFLQNQEDKEGDDNDNDDDDTFLKVRAKTKEELDNEEAEASTLRNQLASKLPSNEQQALKIYFEQEPENESEQFLRDYVLNREWADHDEGMSLPSRSYSKDSRDQKNTSNVDIEDERDEQADRFERAYNFRFEEPLAKNAEGAGTKHIATYARNAEGSMRRKGEKRKDKREQRKIRKKEEKKKKREELKRLKNLKREEMYERFKKIAKETGMDMNGENGINMADLEGDFDPDAFDAKMSSMYNDDYYNEEQMKQNDANEKELYDLEYEDIVGGQKTRFKYRSVEATAWGLTTEEILTAPDKVLGQFVSVKKLAPYQEEEWVVSARQRRQFRQNMFRQDEDGNRLRKERTEKWSKDEEEDNIKNGIKHGLKQKEIPPSTTSTTSTSSSSSLSTEQTQQQEEDISSEVIEPPKPKKKRLRKKQAARAAKQGKDLDELRAELMAAEEAAALANPEAAAAAALEKANRRAKKKRNKKKRKQTEKQHDPAEKISNRLSSYGDDVVAHSKKKHKSKK